MMNWSKRRWALQPLCKISLKNWTCCIITQVTDYSSGVNGENQTKKKEKSRVRRSEEVLYYGEEEAG